MKQFFKFTFASMLGFVLALVVLFFLFIGIVSLAVSSMSKEEVSISDKSILHIALNEELSERTSNNPFDKFDLNSFESHKQLGLSDIVKNINKAAKDPNIKGIYLDVPQIRGGFAPVEEIRNALLHFRKSGKFVYAYAEYLSQGSYYLVSAADQIYLNPEGMVDLHGIAIEMMFYKGLLEKMEIEPQVIRHGKYKSAIEPYVLDRMSDENRTQIAELINPIWDHIVTQIASSRRLEKSAVARCADSLLCRDAEEALHHKLIDHIAYYDEFNAELKAKSGLSKDAKLKLVTLNAYNKVKDTDVAPYSADRIALIYAEGAIESGEGDDQTIGSERLSKAIRDARLDSKVKAIVMRVNSPGGSALASDVIWREVTLAKAAKPFVISMGSVAASGGYYISCAADTIVAQPNTITGSIGVFGLMFNAKQLLNNKLGITTDTYKTGAYSDMGTVTRPLSNAEKAIMQRSVEQIYQTFTQRVSAGRGIPQNEVDSIGQGRVWSGIDAKRIGLVDVLGGLEDAIAIAAKMGNVSEYRLRELPEQKDPMESFIKGLSGEAETRYLSYKLGDDFRFWNAAKSVTSVRGIQARMLYSFGFN